MAAHGVFRSLIVGVDRLDYSKGLPERLLGFEHFLGRIPDMVRKVLYLQIAPSRAKAWRPTRRCARRCWRWPAASTRPVAEMDHAPMLCVNRNYGRAELAGIYRAARVGLVTAVAGRHEPGRQGIRRRPGPRRSGRAGLSRFAGAAEQMTDAMIVNPYCAEELADAIAAALEMPRPERVRRWQRLMDGVERFDVGAWRDDFVAALRAAREAPDAERPWRVPPMAGHLIEDRETLELRARAKTHLQ